MTILWHATRCVSSIIRLMGNENAKLFNHESSKKGRKRERTISGGGHFDHARAYLRYAARKKAPPPAKC